MASDELAASGKSQHDDLGARTTRQQFRVELLQETA